MQQSQQSQLSPWQNWSLDVQHSLQAQQECIHKLEEQVAALCEQVRLLKARPSYNIESIAYHFDQLKVEKLEGTLNIGMTAPGAADVAFPGTIEQLSVPKAETFPSAGYSIPAPAEPYKSIYAEMNGYLDNEAPQKLHAYENELCIPLDPYHRRIIIEDVRKQLPTRIQHYLNLAYKGSGTATDAAELAPAIESVITKTKRDADSALYAYMKQLTNGSAT